MTAWLPPLAEREIGLSVYATSTPGIGGALKQTAEDFQVREISSYPMPDPAGEYAILCVESTMREQHALVRDIAAALRVSPGRVAWSGTKDRRAVTTQLLSVAHVDAGAIRLDLPGVRLLDAYQGRTGLVLGHHYGNAFEIRLSGLESPVSDAIGATRSCLAELTGGVGVPNFFGPQRFGEVRPVTHLVGRALLREGVDAAVELYLTLQSGPESGPGAEARRAFAEHRDAARALREFPTSFLFERRLLDHLARGHPPARAFRALPWELRRLFVHAYQAWIFNRYLSARLVEGLSPRRPVVGDLLLRPARDGTVPGAAPVPVLEDNLAELSLLVERGRARVAGPLVGYESPPLIGRPGTILGKVLQEEHLAAADFRIAGAPEEASAGSARPLSLDVPPVGLHEELPEGMSPAIRLKFSLPKGAYATVLLREIQKTGAVPIAENVAIAPELGRSKGE